jgi:hypothetical protein
VNQAFQIDLPLPTLFHSPTVASLAAFVDILIMAKQEPQALARAGAGEREDLVL